MWRWLVSGCALSTFVVLGFGSGDSEDSPDADAVIDGVQDVKADVSADGFMPGARALGVADACPNGTRTVLTDAADVGKVWPPLPNVQHPEDFSIQGPDVNALFSKESDAMAVVCVSDSGTHSGPVSLFLPGGTVDFIRVSGVLADGTWVGPIAAHSYQEDDKPHDKAEFEGRISDGAASGAWRFNCVLQDMGHSCVGGANIAGEIKDGTRIGTWTWSMFDGMSDTKLTIEYGPDGAVPAEASLKSGAEGCTQRGKVDHKGRVGDWSGC